MFHCYFQLQTQIHSEILFSYSLIYYFIVIIIRYPYSWYKIINLGFKPVNGHHTQLRSDGGTYWRVRETNDETILKKLDDMAMNSPWQNQEPYQEKENIASQIVDSSGGGQNRGNLRYRGDEGHKLRVPTFDGVDTNGWLVRMDRFFQVSNIPVREKLNYAVLGLMGRILRGSSSGRLSRHFTLGSNSSKTCWNVSNQEWRQIPWRHCCRSNRQALSWSIGVILSSWMDHTEIWVERSYYVCSVKGWYRRLSWN